MKQLKEVSRDFKGIWIPREIWLADDLTPLQIIILAEINSLDNDKEKGCTASNKYLSDFLGTTERQVREHLGELKRKGYIIQCSFDGRVRGLRVSSRPEEIPSCCPTEKPPVREDGFFQSSIRDNKDKIKEDNTTSFDKNKKYLPLARLLYEEHKKHDDKFLHGLNGQLERTLYKWADDIRLLIEKDGRDYNTVERVIKWVQAPGCFWIPNILSGSKLREKFPTLVSQMPKKDSSRIDYYERNKDAFHGTIFDSVDDEARKKAREEAEQRGEYVP